MSLQYRKRYYGSSEERRKSLRFTTLQAPEVSGLVTSERRSHLLTHESEEVKEDPHLKAQALAHDSDTTEGSRKRKKHHSSSSHDQKKMKRASVESRTVSVTRISTPIYEDIGSAKIFSTFSQEMDQEANTMKDLSPVFSPFGSRKSSFTEDPKVVASNSRSVSPISEKLTKRRFPVSLNLPDEVGKRPPSIKSPLSCGSGTSWDDIVASVSPKSSKRSPSYEKETCSPGSVRQLKEQHIPFLASPLPTTPKEQHESDSYKQAVQSRTPTPKGSPKNSLKSDVVNPSKTECIKLRVNKVTSAVNTNTKSIEDSTVITNSCAGVTKSPAIPPQPSPMATKSLVLSTSTFTNISPSPTMDVGVTGSTKPSSLSTTPVVISSIKIPRSELPPSIEACSIPRSEPALIQKSEPHSIPRSESTLIPRSESASVLRSEPSSVSRSVPRAEPAPVLRAKPRSDPISVPRSKPTSVLRPDPASIPRSEPASIPRSEPASEPASIPRSEPASIPRSEPASIPRPEPASIPRPEPASIPRPEPASIPRSEPASIPRSEPASIPRSEPASIPRSEPARSGPATVPRYELIQAPRPKAHVTTTPMGATEKTIIREEPPIPATLPNMVKSSALPQAHQVANLPVTKSCSGHMSPTKVMSPSKAISQPPDVMKYKIAKPHSQPIRADRGGGAHITDNRKAETASKKEYISKSSLPKRPRPIAPATVAGGTSVITRTAPQQLAESTPVMQHHHRQQIGKSDNTGPNAAASRSSPPNIQGKSVFRNIHSQLLSPSAS